MSSEIIFVDIIYLETICEEPIVKESVCYNELDHDNNEIEKFAEYESTKINVVSEKRKFIQFLSIENQNPTCYECCGRRIELVSLFSHLDLQ